MEDVQIPDEMPQELEQELEQEQEQRQRVEQEAETSQPGLPESIINAIKADLNHHGSRIVDEHKAAFTGLTSQLSAHQNQLAELASNYQSMQAFLNSHNSGRQSAFMKQGYQLMDRLGRQ